MLLTTSLISVSDGASSSFTNVHVTFSPRPSITEFTCPVELEHVSDVCV